jgi:sugar (pentulose or hexulose) kinase
MLAGLGAKRIVIDGGLSRSELFAKTFAALSPLPVSKSPVVEATALGAAMIASVGSGVHSDFAKAARAMVRDPSRLRVDRRLKRTLDQRSHGWHRWSKFAIDSDDPSE